MLRNVPILLAFLAGLPLAVLAQTGPGQSSLAKIDNPHRLVQLDGIQVTGTHLPPESIVRISGLKLGQMINDTVLKQASDKITSTGLVKGLDYGYNVEPGKPGVFLTLRVFDEGPLLPVRIYPEQDGQPIWSCLKSADPIFTREMPNTQKALHFYAINMERCIANSGVHDTVTATVACDGTGKSIAIDFHVAQPNAR